MCGNVGVAGDLDTDAVSIFKELLYVDALRGKHGTGVAAVPFGTGRKEPKKTTIIKAPVNSSDFLEMTAVKELLRNTNHAALIGHNRHATVGKHVYENTHPFKNSHVVGCHNGTVNNSTSLVHQSDDWGNTDSERIINNIGYESVEDVIPKCQGAWALVWYNFEDNTINFIRNKERPLYYAFNEDRSQLFWASEAHMLRWVATRSNRTVLETSKKGSSVVIREFPVDTHFQWAVPSYRECFGDEERKKVEGKKYTPQRTSTVRNTGTNSYRHSSNTTTHSHNTTTVMGSGEPAFFTVTATDIARGYSTLLKPMDMKFHDLTKLFAHKRSCCYCTGEVKEEEVKAGKALVLRGNNLLCGDCVEEHEEVKSIIDVNDENETKAEAKEKANG